MDKVRNEEEDSSNRFARHRDRPEIPRVSICSELTGYDKLDQTRLSQNIFHAKEGYKGEVFRASWGNVGGARCQYSFRRIVGQTD